MTKARLITLLLAAAIIALALASAHGILPYGTSDGGYWK